MEDRRRILTSYTQFYNGFVKVGIREKRKQQFIRSGPRPIRVPYFRESLQDDSVVDTSSTTVGARNALKFSLGCSTSRVPLRFGWLSPELGKYVARQ
jgi:hypothetical protein